MMSCLSSVDPFPRSVEQEMLCDIAFWGERKLETKDEETRYFYGKHEPLQSFQILLNE